MDYNSELYLTCGAGYRAGLVKAKQIVKLGYKMKTHELQRMVG